MSAWTALAVFGDEDAPHGACCSCCEGYCPRWDEGPREPTPPMLYRVGPYVSDKFVAILEELVEIPEGTTVIDAMKATKELAGWVVLDEKPGPSTARFVPSRVARLTALGIEVCEGLAHDKPQHLYQGDRHIGYLMPAPRGRTLSEIVALQHMTGHLTKETREIIDDLRVGTLDGLMVLTDVGRQLAEIEERIR